MNPIRVNYLGGKAENNKDIAGEYEGGGRVSIWPYGETEKKMTSNAKVMRERAVSELEATWVCTLDRCGVERAVVDRDDRQCNVVFVETGSAPR